MLIHYLEEYFDTNCQKLEIAVGTAGQAAVEIMAQS